MDTKIVEKIKKLLALSESSNEHEAELSLLKAQELLAKHKLSLKEVKEFKLPTSTIKENATNITFTKAKWKALLAGLIAENFGCYHYLKTLYSHTIVFFGREEDVFVCNIVLEYAMDCIDSSVKRIKYQYTKAGNSTKGLENDYALGFIAGLKKKFEEQKKNNQDWGLVLIKDKEVVEAYEQIKFTKKVNTSIQFQGHSKAYERGYDAGEEFSISDKISNSAEETLELKA